VNGSCWILQHKLATKPKLKPIGNVLASGRVHGRRSRILQSHAAYSSLLPRKANRPMGDPTGGGGDAGRMKECGEAVRDEALPGDGGDSLHTGSDRKENR
jgi:hypothetical protein